MKKLLAGLLLALSSSAQEADDINTIYLVSSRPLASFYSHPLSANIVRNTDKDVYALYITLGYGDYGTSSEQLMHSVALDIQRVDPQMIIVDEVDATSYLLTLLPEKYKNITYFINRSFTDGIPRSRLFRIENLGFKITSLVSAMNLFPDTYYILYDTTGLTARDSYNLKNSLQAITGSVKSFEVSSVKQLEALLTKLNENQRGVIINNMMALTDDEFGSIVKMKEIKEILQRKNSKHLSIGFSYLPEIDNECLVFQLDYGSVVNDFISNNIEPEDMNPLPFRVYVDKSRMRSLGFKKNYIAAHEDIDVLVE